MKKQNTLSHELSKKVSIMSTKTFGLGRMFNHLRKMRICENLSDLAILRLILWELKLLNKFPSKNQIGHHFRTKVSAEDWEGSNKREVLEDLNNPTP